MDMEWSTAMANGPGLELDSTTGVFNYAAQIYSYDGVNSNSSTFTDAYNQVLSDGLARIFSTSWREGFGP